MCAQATEKGEVWYVAVVEQETADQRTVSARSGRGGPRARVWRAKVENHARPQAHGPG